MRHCERIIHAEWTAGQHVWMLVLSETLSWWPTGGHRRRWEDRPPWSLHPGCVTNLPKALQAAMWNALICQKNKDSHWIQSGWMMQQLFFTRCSSNSDMKKHIFISILSLLSLFSFRLYPDPTHYLPPRVKVDMFLCILHKHIITAGGLFSLKTENYWFIIGLTYQI